MKTFWMMLLSLVLPSPLIVRDTIGVNARSFFVHMTALAFGAGRWIIEDCEFGTSS